MSLAKNLSVFVIEANKSALILAPKLIHKPKVILHWLITARWAQIALLALALTMPSLLPNAVDGIVNTISPAPKPKSAVQRISSFLRHAQGSSSEFDEKRENRQKITRTLLWSGSGVLVILLLWLHIPKGVNLASRLAREREEKADILASTNPLQSMLLYQSAIALSVSPDAETSLNEKIAAIDQVSAVSRARDTSSSSVTSTHWQQTNYIAPGSHQNQPSMSAAGTRYRMKKLLGKGAMGYVYLARDTVLDREVAIKQLLPQWCHDEQFIGRFKQEAKALAKLSHPNIVHVHDLVEESDYTWIIMEYVNGEELALKITPGEAMDFDVAVTLTIQMSKAMQYAHDQGVVHRDFKPANVLVAADNSAKIMDFGLAKFVHSAGLTQVGTVMGSPAYMSPEQAAGKPVDWRTDIYALGVTLYLMFCGVLPFDGDTPSVISQHLSAAPISPKKRNNAIPASIDRIILKMMAKQPEDRPVSMKEVYKAFQSLQKRKKTA